MPSVAAGGVFPPASSLRLTTASAPVVDRSSLTILGTSGNELSMSRVLPTRQVTPNLAGVRRLSVQGRLRRHFHACIGAAGNLLLIGNQGMAKLARPADEKQPPSAPLCGVASTFSLPRWRWRQRLAVRGTRPFTRGFPRAVPISRTSIAPKPKNWKLGSQTSGLSHPKSWCCRRVEIWLSAGRREPISFKSPMLTACRRC